MTHPTVEKRWYVLQVTSGFEAAVKSVLEENIKLNHLEHRFGDVLVPKEKIVEMKAGQKKESERKYFPGYVLIQMDLDDETWHFVRKIPKVLGFVGTKRDKPTPLTDAEANRILADLKENVTKAKPKVMFEVGEVIRVADGPFADFNGVVEEVFYEKSRLRVSVTIFGRSTPVDLEFSQVEKQS